MFDSSKCVELAGDTKHSSHTVKIKPDGSLEAELYDFSDECNDALGDDFAWLATVAAELKPRVLELLQQEPNIPDLPKKKKMRGVPQGGLPVDPDGELLRRMQLRFQRFNDVKDWLREKGVPFTESTDSRA